MPTLSKEAEKILLDDFTEVFENNDEGGHYEYRSFVPRDMESIKGMLAQIEQSAIQAERERKLPFPEHKASLSLTHNPHLDLYESVKQHLDGREDYFDEWATESSKERAISTNELWVLHWYPNTPVGFNVLCGATLSEIFEAITERTDAKI